MQNSIKFELLIGTEIDIKRTDGRIHSAIVSSIEKEAEIVTVEWFEKGEAKGKEIEFEDVLQMNPSFSFVTKKKFAKSCEQIDDKNSKTDDEALSDVPTTMANKEYEDTKELDNFLKPSSSQASQNTPKISNVMSKSMVLPSPVSKKLQFDETAKSVSVSIEPKKSHIPKKPPLRSKRRLTCVEEIERIHYKREERRAAAGKPRRFSDSHDPYFEYRHIILDYQTNNLPKHIDFPKSTLNDKIVVCIRKRPMNIKELEKKEIDVVSVLDYKKLIVHDTKVKVDLTKYVDNQQFFFDYVFDEKISTKTIYNCVIKSMLQKLFNGENSTCFAYGQTGSGKTYTMNGNEDEDNPIEGISLLCVKEAIEIRNHRYPNDEVQIEVAYFEIYNGKVYDLLNRRVKLQILENKSGEIQLVGLMTERIETWEDALDYLDIGNELRSSGQSAINQNSSRSHAVFQIILKNRSSPHFHKRDQHNPSVISKFSLIDLAGSERGHETFSSKRIERMEAADINKSLLALKECIRALDKKGQHIPFRGSKLTLVLKDSFISENSRTCMIAMISPNISSTEHTLNTLRYADRVKSISKSCDNIAQKTNVDNEASNGTQTSDETNSITDKICVEEERITNIHAEMIKEHLPMWNKTHRQTYKMSKKVDYNIDCYSENLEAVLDEQVKYIKSLKEKVDILKSYLADEESLNKTLQ